MIAAKTKWLAVSGLVVLVAAWAVADDDSFDPRDITKAVIERPAKELLVETTPFVPDVGKYAVERPLKEVLSATTTTPAQAKKFANPKVAPGLVGWHSGFAAAREAARKSGKPVLLFHLLGKLDDEFC